MKYDSRGKYVEVSIHANNKEDKRDSKNSLEDSLNEYSYGLMH